MTGTAVTKVDRDTGEVTELRFDLSAYLDDVSSARSLTQQQKLAAAYDAACLALIGENDVQKEGARTFKKKSAWRKLARHFCISTAVVREDRQNMAPPEGLTRWTFIATCVVKASAPWGQSAEATGACATDEETGRRKITIADAIATAETRATNRAISNLIAMGEVSAEEMRKEPMAFDPASITPDSLVTWGKMKGKALKEMNDNYLTWMCEPDRKFGGEEQTAVWQSVARRILKEREGKSTMTPKEQAVAAAVAESPTQSTDEFPEQLEEDDDDGLPF